MFMTSLFDVIKRATLIFMTLIFDVINTSSFDVYDVDINTSNLDVYDFAIRRHKHEQLRCL
jgi:hypothetical protein